MPAYPLTWLADVLRAAGCQVVEEGDWRHRGRDGSFAPKAVMLHHDASPRGETSDGADVIINGRDDLPGPLAHLWLDYGGRWHVIAAGRANHGGTGGPWGVVSVDDANADCIGIETDHTADEQWTSSQRSEGIKGVAALCARLGITRQDEIGRAVLAHKEYTSRKIDPDPLNMTTARANLYAYMTGKDDAPVDTVQKSCSTPRTLTGGGKWRDLQFDDNTEVAGGPYILIGGPTSWHVTTVQAYVSGPPGTPFQLRPYRTSNGHDETYLFAVRDYVIPADGTIGVEVAHQGGLSDGWYLRVQGVSLGADVVVTKAWAEIARW